MTIYIYTCVSVFALCYLYVYVSLLLCIRICLARARATQLISLQARLIALMSTMDGGLTSNSTHQCPPLPLLLLLTLQLHPPSIMEAHRVRCPLYKLWFASPGLFMMHCKDTQHSANYLYLLRKKPFLKCIICNKLMLGPLEVHLVSKRHATNWYRLVVQEVKVDCNVYDYVRVVNGYSRPHTPRVGSPALRCSGRYRQHLQIRGITSHCMMAT